MRLAGSLRHRLNLAVARLERKRRLRDVPFSIISQNCIGGCVYHDLGLPFTSPTINLTIPGENFVRFVENLPRYLALRARPAGRRRDEDMDYPLIRVGDITVHAMHYESDKDAARAWNRRRKRVNLDNVHVVACTWNLNEDAALVERLGECGYPTVVFSGYPSDNPLVVPLVGDYWSMDERGITRPLLTGFDDRGVRNYAHAFDFADWLNHA